MFDVYIDQTAFSIRSRLLLRSSAAALEQVACEHEAAAAALDEHPIQDQRDGLAMEMAP